MTVTESLVDAKDEARQTESREALANALLRIEERFDSQTKWIVGVIVGMTSIMIAVTAAMMGLTTCRSGRSFRSVPASGGQPTLTHTP